jgi:predicted phage terminase large subunit-like protein
VNNYRPSVALIEKTADGPALYARVWKKAKFEIKMIVPQGPKAVRFINHLGTIRDKNIFLPENAIWREAFVAEVIGFPGEFDDQVDAMTQYLDFMDTDPVIPLQAPRESGIAIAFASHFPRRRF